MEIVVSKWIKPKTPKNAVVEKVSNVFVMWYYYFYMVPAVDFGESPAALKLDPQK